MSTAGASPRPTDFIICFYKNIKIKDETTTGVISSLMARRKGFEPPTFWFVAATIPLKRLL